MTLLHIENLSVTFQTHQGAVKVLDRVSLKMQEGEVLGIIGESGSGKTMLALAIMGLLAPTAEFTADYLSIDGQDLMKLGKEQRRQFIAKHTSLIFQDPLSSLNPCFTIGTQLTETIQLHGMRGYSRQKRRALELLESVGINNPLKQFKRYPHQLSGGMNQRVMIAMALASEPKLLIADEPTTALDVTIQAQILELLLSLNSQSNMALMLITHDFALLSETTQKVCVMYSGQIMEKAFTRKILNYPKHPYTHALINSIPHIGERHATGERLFSLKGSIPAIYHLPVGCRLGPRCPQAAQKCVQPPPLKQISDYGLVRCHFPLSDNINLAHDASTPKDTLSKSNE